MVSELEAHSMDVEFKTRAVLLELLQLKKQLQTRLDADSPQEVMEIESQIEVIDNSIDQFRFSGWF